MVHMTSLIQTTAWNLEDLSDTEIINYSETQKS